MSEAGVIPPPEEQRRTWQHGGDPYVRHLGEVSDINDVRVHVGVDYDAVTVGRYTLPRAAAEEFAHMFVAACWEAAENHRRMGNDMSPPY